MSAEGVTHKENEVDVLIIGAGPAGYMAELWFARLGVNTRIIDKRSARIFTGQADGLQPRVLEVFETFGFADRALKEVAVGFEACYYNPDENGHIRHVETVPEGIPGISRFNGSIVHQGRIETWLMDAITEFSGGRTKVERPIQPESLEFNPGGGEYPTSLGIPCRMGRTDSSKVTKKQHRHHYRGRVERSCGPNTCWAAMGHTPGLKQLGIENEGETTDFVWGVLDMVPTTDFPDIRKRCSIHSKNNGSIMIIPRENQLVRLYIQLRELAHNGEMDEDNVSPDHDKTKTRHVDRNKVTAKQILDSARKILSPYTLDAAEIHWFMAYQVGQRVASAFEKQERVFIAGDACHTHSPKAGQGMNVSMMGEISTQEFRRVIEQGAAFTTGCTVNYDRSILMDKPTDKSRETPYHSSLASRLSIGMRVPDVKLVMESDGRPWFFNQRLLSTGQFRVVVFIGDYTRRLGSCWHSIVELLLIHASPQVNVEWDDFPSVFRQRDDRGVVDYWKILADRPCFHDETGHVYEQYGIDKEVGAIVVLRPDGYVAKVAEPTI
ncbi:uncharacterized protein TRUGW13939_00901, partial [Talaromyces rugulosus]